MLSDAVVRATAEAVSIEHRINHVPKHPLSATFAIVPSSFRKGFAVTVFPTQSQTCQKVQSLVNRSQLITWLFQCLQGGRSFLFWCVRLIKWDSQCISSIIKRFRFCVLMSPSFCWPEIQKPRHCLPQWCCSRAVLSWFFWACKVLKSRPVNGSSRLNCVSRRRCQGWGESSSSVWRHCSLSSHQSWWTQLDCGLWTPWWQWNFHQRLHQSICSVLFEFIPTCLCTLPIELVPDHAKHIHQPCAPLIKSLYGHPLASASWQNHLSKVLAQELGGIEFEQLPSCFYFPSLRLALSVYVDDLTFSGPSANHSKCWEVLRKVVQLEDPAPLSKVLGRGHIKHDGGLALHPADFARQLVKLFEELSGKPVKHVRTPHVDEGSLVATDQADRGQLSNVAAKLVMKIMWLARISRPDLMVAINVCAGHITKWTVNDDKRMTRLAGYVAATLDHCHVMRVLDKPSDLRLSLYADADFGSAPDMKSTSAYLLALWRSTIICFDFMV